MTFPWFKCNPRDFREGMVGLTREERGTYATVLLLIYERAGPVPDDDAAWMAGHLWCTVKAWKKDRDSLVAKGKLYRVEVDGRPHLMNQRAAEELAEREALSEARSEAGKLTVRSRAPKKASGVSENNDLGSANHEQTAAVAQVLLPQDKEIRDSRNRDDDDSARVPLRTSDWSRDSLDSLQARLRAAAGASINAASPSLPILAAIVGLLTPGQGPACDLELDVLPTVEAAGKKARPGSVNRWEYFRPMIVEARDKRLSGAPVAKTSPASVVGWDDDVWEAAVANYFRDGSWGSKMGPKPGESGCIAPRHILEKYLNARSAA